MDETTQQLEQFYQELLRLQKEGTKEAQAQLAQRFAALPEALRDDLIARLYLEALDRKIEEEDAIAAVQERGLEILDELEQVAK